MKKTLIYLLPIILCLNSLILVAEIMCNDNIKKADPSLRGLFNAVNAKPEKSFENYKTLDNGLIALPPSPEIYKGIIAYRVVESEYIIDAFIKTNGNFDELEKLGVNVRTIVGNICTADFSIELLPLINELNSVVSVKAATPMKILSSGNATTPNLDISTDVIGATMARDTFNVTGRDVILGFVDTGLDFDHPSLWWNPESKTNSRVLAYWDQENTLVGYEHPDYGSVYETYDLNIHEFPYDGDPIGHGTSVVSIAAGHYGRYQGVAPFADIVFVQFSEIRYNSTQVIDGIDFMCDIAEEHNKPLVVNLSLGGHSKSHDGMGPYEETLGLVLNQRKDVLMGIVVSAGNENYVDTLPANIKRENDKVHSRKTGTDDFGVDIITVPGDSSDKILLRIWYFYELFENEPPDYWVTITSPNGRSYGPVEYGDAAGATVSTNQKYRYTGKPYDEEGNFNLYYYGARYYDSYLGRFPAIDPMRGKYPSLSPYNYALNNPMSNIDLNGDSVTVVQDVEIGPPAPEVLEYEKARDELMSTKEGATLVQEVESNEHANTIDLEGNHPDPNRAKDPNLVTVANPTESQKAVNGKGTKAHVQFIPNPSTPVKINGKVQGTTIRLGHELSHVNHINKGTAALNKTAEQRNAVKQENKIRKQLGLPKRKK